MNYKIVPMLPFKVIGFQRVFEEATAYIEIPKFWDEVMGRFANNVFAGKDPINEIEKAVVENRVGEYGVCVDELGEGRFRYLIAGEYSGGKVPEGMVLCELPKGEWAVFDCVGPLPGALQSVNTKIYKEWLPDNPDYELSGNSTVEWYGEGKTDSEDYHSAIWIPVKRKAKQ